MGKFLTVSRKKTKILTVNRKSHHPIETLILLSTSSCRAHNRLSNKIRSTIRDKKTPEGVYAGCASVCKDYFERSRTVAEYMG